jgi:hypothetical protein
MHLYILYVIVNVIIIILHISLLHHVGPLGIIYAPKSDMVTEFQSRFFYYITYYRERRAHGRLKLKLMFMLNVESPGAGRKHKHKIYNIVI